MNSKGHFVASIIKSFIRISGCAIALVCDSWMIGMVMLIAAEGMGVVEELLDMR